MPYPNYTEQEIEEFRYAKTERFFVLDEDIIKMMREQHLKEQKAEEEIKRKKQENIIIKKFVKAMLGNDKSFQNALKLYDYKNMDIDKTLKKFDFVSNFQTALRIALFLIHSKQKKYIQQSIDFLKNACEMAKPAEKRIIFGVLQKFWKLFSTKPVQILISTLDVEYKARSFEDKLEFIEYIASINSQETITLALNYFINIDVTQMSDEKQKLYYSIFNNKLKIKVTLINQVGDELLKLKKYVLAKKVFDLILVKEGQSFELLVSIALKFISKNQKKVANIYFEQTLLLDVEKSEFERIGNLLVKNDSTLADKFFDKSNVSKNVHKCMRISANMIPNKSLSKKYLRLAVKVADIYYAKKLLVMWEEEKGAISIIFEELVTKFGKKGVLKLKDFVQTKLNASCLKIFNQNVGVKKVKVVQTSKIIGKGRVSDILNNVLNLLDD